MTFLDSRYKWDHTVFVLTYFTQHNVLQVISCCHREWFPPFLWLSNICMVFFVRKNLKEIPYLASLNGFALTVYTGAAGVQFALMEVNYSWPLPSLQEAERFILLRIDTWSRYGFASTTLIASSRTTSCLKEYLVYNHNTPHNIASGKETNFTAKKVEHQAHTHGINWF